MSNKRTAKSRLIGWLTIIVIGIAGIWMLYDVYLKNKRECENVMAPSPPYSQNGTVYHVSTGRACKFGEKTCTDAIILNGSINALMFKDLVDTTKANPGINTICLNSNGGNVHFAKEIADFVHDKGYSFCLAEEYWVEPVDSNTSEEQVKIVNYNNSPMRCYSACLFLFLGAQDRIRIGTDIDSCFWARKTALESGYISFE